MIDDGLVNLRVVKSHTRVLLCVCTYRRILIRLVGVEENIHKVCGVDLLDEIETDTSHRKNILCII